MDHWRRTAQQRRDGWAFLRAGAKADVMLLQESVIPADVPRNRYVHREIAGSRPWGSSVVALVEGAEVREIDAVRTCHGATRFSMLGSYPGAVIVSRVELPGVGPLTCVSVYGVINVYAQTTMFRIVADLIPLFDSRDGQQVVLGGDFNVTSAMKNDAPELPRYRAILNAVESLGLVNLATCDISRPDPIVDCPCAERSCRHLRTFGSNPGTQLDWLYATRELARRCVRLRVDHGVLGTLSDHAPIIAEFRLGPSEGARVVDPESFLEELGIRAGPDCARVAEGLIDWVYRKHGALDAGGPRVASLDRLPTDSRQLWVQLDMRRPQRLQYTFSLTVEGQVVIQFQWMISPFDGTAARERLWTQLSQIPGISLDKRLNGRPSFPLKALDNPDRLEMFERIFSEMLDETIRFQIAAG
jgi:endonuclease/exonuclease/phosphatase family metal-dependent hydrolase